MYAKLMAVPRLSNIERQILVLDHMLDLFPHSECKQNDEVHEKNRPEDRDIKDREKGKEQRQERGSCRIEPELKLGQSPYERTEFFLCVLWLFTTFLKRRGLQLLLKGWIEFWSEECKE